MNLKFVYNDGTGKVQFTQDVDGSDREDSVVVVPEEVAKTIGMEYDEEEDSRRVTVLDMIFEWDFSVING